LFDTASLRKQHYSLCVADDSSLRLGVIDDIQKLHVTTCRLGMAPRRIVHCIDGRLFAVGCVESGIKHFGLGGAEATSMANCIRFMDDTNFDDIHRVDLEAYEQVLSMVYVSLKVPSKDGTSADGSTQGAQYKPFLLVGTGYALPDENEPTRGRIIVYSCQADEAAAATTNRAVREVAQHSTTGGVYSMSQFYEGNALCTVNSKTMIGQLVDDAGLKFSLVGQGHHGHILSLCVKSRARPMVPEPTSASTAAAAAASGIAMDSTEVQDNAAGIIPKKPAAKQEQLAIVGDLMRSISLVQYYPQHGTLEEVARDFNANWTTAVEMLTDDGT
jgi:DNA damage-binding protein 1